MRKLQKAWTSQVIKGLERRSLIKREQSSDGRAKNVSLTDKGAETLSQALPTVEKADAEFFNVLATNDKALLLVLFQKLTRST